MTPSASTPASDASPRPVRLAYLVSHPIQYQAPLLRRIAQEPDIDLTVLFGSDFSVRSYKDEGFGVELAWDTPLTEGYKHEFLHTLRDIGTVSSTSPISTGILRRLRGSGLSPSFDALWVHGYASVNALHGIAAANALGIPVILRAESWLRDRQRSGLKLAIKKLYFRILGSMLSAVLPIGTFNALYWRHYFGSRVPQFLMPYAVDNDYFARKAAEAAPLEHELRASLSLDPLRPVILFASKLQQRKHCDHLIEAYIRFTASRQPGQPVPYLIIVGDGEERARLETLCRDAGLADVRFAGFQNQSVLPRYLQLADVFVLPSRHEPWGLIVNEAMAAGCAVIASDDVGSHADLITDGVEGFVFPTGDIAALTAALEYTFATPESAAALGRRAAARIRSWSFEEDIQGLRAALAQVTRKLRP
jgi:glycosyltransferase involved in cell wall biosynthesis